MTTIRPGMDSSGESDNVRGATGAGAGARASGAAVFSVGRSGAVSPEAGSEGGAVSVVGAGESGATADSGAAGAAEVGISPSKTTSLRLAQAAPAKIKIAGKTKRRMILSLRLFPSAAPILIVFSFLP